jgi:wyosine [tRNA(Phe)-imidazoG37] synthetase (radical SAM superfamily)
MNETENRLNLQSQVIYGPVKSRRLGNSLGLNLSPKEIKLCSLNCAYCQYSWTGLLVREAKPFKNLLPSADEVLNEFRKKLKDISDDDQEVNSITFSGNGEPTLHPDFLKIVEGVVKIRDEYLKDAKISCLSNSTTLCNNDVLKAMKMIDEPIMKFDTAVKETFLKLNRPAVKIEFEEIEKNLMKLDGKMTIQTLFVEGSVDNTGNEELRSYINSLRSFKPRLVQIYSLDRLPADKNLIRVSKQKLNEIKKKIEREVNLKVVVY